MRWDDDNLEQLIGNAFRRLPEPDPARLKAIASRLRRAAVREPAPRWRAFRYGWLIAGLVATGAAAWWAGEHAVWRNAPVAATTTTSFDTEPKRSATEQPGAEQSAPQMEPPAKIKRETPNVYRREAY